MNNIINSFKPNLLADLLEKIPKDAAVLDLGCGEGRDSLFLVQQGFRVTAVDKSSEVINKLAELAKQENLSNLDLQCSDIVDFKIELDKYYLINVSNVLHFLPTELALNILASIKNSLKVGGYFVFTGFTAQDALYRDGKGFFCVKALQNIFFDWFPIFSDEKLIMDKAHQGYLQNHQHHLAQFIAQKGN